MSSSQRVWKDFEHEETYCQVKNLVEFMDLSIKSESISHHSGLSHIRALEEIMAGVEAVGAELV